MGLLDILNQALSANTNQVSPDHVDEITTHATTDQLSGGLAEAFRSDKTPAFGDMVGQLFGNSTGSQRAGMLNQVIAALGPAVIGSLAGGALGKMLQPGSTQLTPAQASQLSPAQVSEIAAAAEQRQPGIVDNLSKFYAEHPTLIKTLGSGALLIALSKLKRDMENR